MEVAVEFIQGQGGGDARDFKQKVGDALDGRPVDGGHLPQRVREQTEVNGRSDDGGQPLLFVPVALFGGRAADLADADDFGGHAGDFGCLFEDQRRNELGLAVAAGGNGEVVQRLLGHHPVGVVPLVDGGDGGDEDDGHVLVGFVREVDQVAAAADVRLEGLDGDVEVDGPLVVDDAVDGLQQGVVDLSVETEVGARQVGVVELALGEVGREATAGGRSGLARLAVLGTVEADDLGHARGVRANVNHVGTDGAGGAGDDNHLALVGGRGLVLLGSGQILGVLLHERFHAVVFVVRGAVGGVLVVLVDDGKEVVGQALGSGVAVDDTGGKGRGIDVDTGSGKTLADEAGGSDGLHGVDAGSEEIGVSLELGSVEGRLEQLLDGEDQSIGRREVKLGDLARGSALLGIIVDLVDLELVHADGTGALDGALARAQERLAGGRQSHVLAADLAVRNRLLVDADHSGPDVIQQSLAALFGRGMLKGLDDQSRLEPVHADHHSTLDLGVALDRLLNGDGVELLTVGENNNVIGAALVDPVVLERGMGLVQVLGAVLLGVGEGVEEALETGVLLLADDHLLVRVVTIMAAPVDAKELGVKVEVAPELPVVLPVVGERSELGRRDDVAERDAVVDQPVTGLGSEVAAAKGYKLERLERLDSLIVLRELLKNGGRQRHARDVGVLDVVEDEVGREGALADAQSSGRVPVVDHEHGDVHASGVVKGHCFAFVSVDQGPMFLGGYSLGCIILFARLAISATHMSLPSSRGGRLWYLSAIASIPCLATMGLGKPVLPEV